MIRRLPISITISIIVLFPAQAAQVSTGIARPKETEAAFINPAALANTPAAVEFNSGYQLAENGLGASLGLVAGYKVLGFGANFQYDMNAKAYEAAGGVAFGVGFFSVGASATVIRSNSGLTAQKGADGNAGIRVGSPKSLTLSAVGYHLAEREAPRHWTGGLAYRVVRNFVLEIDTNYYPSNFSSRYEVVVGTGWEITPRAHLAVDYSFYPESFSSGSLSAAVAFQWTRFTWVEGLFRRGPGTLGVGILWLL